LGRLTTLANALTTITRCRVYAEIKLLTFTHIKAVQVKQFAKRKKQTSYNVGTPSVMISLPLVTDTVLPVYIVFTSHADYNCTILVKEVMLSAKSQETYLNLSSISISI